MKTSKQGSKASRRALLSVGVLALVVSACASRPTVDALATSIQSSAGTVAGANITPEIARCIATGLLDTDLSDTTLDGLAEDFNNAEVLSTEIELTNEIVMELRFTCGATPTQ